MNASPNHSIMADEELCMFLPSQFPGLNSSTGGILILKIVIYTSTTSKPTPNNSSSPKNSGRESVSNASFPSSLLSPLTPKTTHPKSTRSTTNSPSPTVPELRIYTFWDKPIGPHPIAMFEVNLFTPAQFGAFIPWLVINRGPLSALLHPNTVDEEGKMLDEYRDHTQRATWLGTPVVLDLSMFRNRGQ